MKIRNLTITMVAGASMFLIGCTSSPSSQSEGIDGAIVYANNCNRCHEYRSPTEFTGPQWSIITTHMRVVGGIPADESRAVFEYLKSQHHPAYVAPPGEGRVGVRLGPNDGKALVQGKGCIGCHVIEGAGGTMGPALDGVTTRRSREYVSQQLLDPQANNPASLMPKLGFDEAQVDAIWAYLNTLDTKDGG